MTVDPLEIALETPIVPTSVSLDCISVIIAPDSADETAIGSIGDATAPRIAESATELVVPVDSIGNAVDETTETCA
ncbi:hypothetical protein DV706_14095 [Natronorubrum bangense]|uniref:Uncharacterized protein n=2 Tax=Natronorubrum bangense TaxID=61858 RepID=L9WKX6_9EURY|nr:hypothetical protein C494_07720 [Natronorubrum bangense JCM 10635]QCC55500.1 hypothetical protein DV706_14095 [Natronorubrum bangense]